MNVKGLLQTSFEAFSKSLSRPMHEFNGWDELYTIMGYSGKSSPCLRFADLFLNLIVSRAVPVRVVDDPYCNLMASRAFPVSFSRPIP